MSSQVSLGAALGIRSSQEGSPHFLQCPSVCPMQPIHHVQLQANVPPRLGVPGPAVSAPQGNVSDMQAPGPHPAPQ